MYVVYMYGSMRWMCVRLCVSVNMHIHKYILRTCMYMSLFVLLLFYSCTLYVQVIKYKCTYKVSKANNKGNKKEKNGHRESSDLSSTPFRHTATKRKHCEICTYVWVYV